MGDELAWEGFATMLKRGQGAEDAPRDPEFEDPPVTAQWRVPGDIGRRYAAVSGDRNPIHMHALSAKAFGFPRAIAHGMWTKARCLAALRLPDALEADVRFKQAAAAALDGDVRRGGRPLRRARPPRGPG